MTYVAKSGTTYHITLPLYWYQLVVPSNRETFMNNVLVLGSTEVPDPGNVFQQVEGTENNVLVGTCLNRHIIVVSLFMSVQSTITY